MDIIIEFIRQITKIFFGFQTDNLIYTEQFPQCCVPTDNSYQKSEDLDARRATANNTNGLQMIVTNVTT